MTRLVPRPDWTPVEFVLAVRAAVWEQGVTPETAANRPTVLALFRPAEEPEVDAATRAEIEKGLAHSARGEVEPYTSAAPAAPCDHPAEDCLPEMTVGPRYGHLRCLRCGAFISPAPAAPPPAGEPAWMTSELRKNLDCMVFVDAQVFSQARGNMSQVFSQARASMVAAIDHAVLSALAALRAENERLRQQLDPPTQSGSFGATTAKVAGNCTKCNGYIYHDPHHIGEYLHECVPPGENRSEG